MDYTKFQSTCIPRFLSEQSRRQKKGIFPDAAKTAVRTAAFFLVLAGMAGGVIGQRPRAPASIHVVSQHGTGDHEIFRNTRRSTYSRGRGLMLEGQPGGQLMWSPDGWWIAFSRRYDPGASVWRVEVKTGAARPGPVGIDEEGAVEWEPGSD